MGEAEEGQLATPAHQTCEHHADHLDGYAGSVGRSRCQSDEDHAEGGGADKEDDADRVWGFVDEVGHEKLSDEGGDDICQQDDAFGDRRADQVQCTCEYHDVEDVIDQT